MRLHPNRTVVVVLVASVFYVALTRPIADFFPDWIAAGVFWYPGLFLAFALCFATTSSVAWWRYPLFVAATSIASFGAILLMTLKWFPYNPPIGLIFGSACGAIAFCALLRWVIGISFLTWQRMLLIAGCASLASLLAHVTAYIPVPQPWRTTFLLASYTLLWWWSFVLVLLWLQPDDDPNLRAHNKHRRSNKGFNRTPERSRPAKPGESGGGAG